MVISLAIWQFGRIGPELYRRMGFADAIIDEMAPMFPEGGLAVWPGILISGLAALGYFVWASRRFHEEVG